MLYQIIPVTNKSPLPLLQWPMRWGWMSLPKVSKHKHNKSFYWQLAASLARAIGLAKHRMQKLHCNCCKKPGSTRSEQIRIQQLPNIYIRFKPGSEQVQSSHFAMQKDRSDRRCMPVILLHAQCSTRLADTLG